MAKGKKTISQKRLAFLSAAMAWSSLRARGTIHMALRAVLCPDAYDTLLHFIARRPGKRHLQADPAAIGTKGIFFRQSLTRSLFLSIL